MKTVRVNKDEESGTRIIAKNKQQIWKKDVGKKEMSPKQDLNIIYIKINIIQDKYYTR